MELIREIIVPTGNSYILNLPDELIGKRVEIIAFEISKEDTAEDDALMDQQKNLVDIREIFKNNLVDMSDFKFDRDEANDYNG